MAGACGGIAKALLRADKGTTIMAHRFLLMSNTTRGFKYIYAAPPGFCMRLKVSEICEMNGFSLSFALALSLVATQTVTAQSSVPVRVVFKSFYSEELLLFWHDPRTQEAHQIGDLQRQVFISRTNQILSLVINGCWCRVSSQCRRTVETDGRY